MNRLAAIFMLFLFSSCDKERLFDGPNMFADSFELYSDLGDMLLEDDVLWSFTQITRSENSVTVETEKSHIGSKSLRFEAKPSDDSGASKASIAKQNMAFWEGETVRLSAWYFIEGERSLQWLFLMDLEEQTAIGAGPGMRLALVDNALRVEYKFNEDDLIQDASANILFPRNEWVEVVWEIELSRRKKGSVRLFQNGQLILDRNDIRTLPRDFLYFQQGTKGMYSNCEIGITGNSHDHPLVLWVDDFSVGLVE